MNDDFLGRLMGNPGRAKILRAFVFNQSQSFTPAMTAKRAGVSTQTAEKEIKVLEQWGILKKGTFSITLANGTKRSVVGGKQKEQAWIFSPAFKYNAAISKFVHEVSPVHYKEIVDVLKRTGRIAAIVLSGTFIGDATRPADLIIAGDSMNDVRLEQAVRALEPLYGREIRYAAFSIPEFKYRLTIQDRLIRDTLDYPHLVLLDKKRLL